MFHSIAIVVSVTMIAANEKSIACVNFSVLVIVCLCFSYINIIQQTSYLVCEMKTKRQKIGAKRGGGGGRGPYKFRFRNRLVVRGVGGTQVPYIYNVLKCDNR